jgi:hypothetical protein
MPLNCPEKLVLLLCNLFVKLTFFKSFFGFLGECPIFGELLTDKTRKAYR